MTHMTVIPAYGRDYTTMAAVRADWDAGKDFIIADITSPYDGKPISKRDSKGLLVSARYNKLTKIISLSKEEGS